MKITGLDTMIGRGARLLGIGVLLFALVGCAGLFGPKKITEEPIIPAESLYASALADMNAQRYNTAISTLAKLERQHPFSQYNEKAKLMTIFADYSLQKYSDTTLAADQYIALFPSSDEMAYVLYLKGEAYFSQIKDITRDQQMAQDAIDTFTMLQKNYPKSKYAEAVNPKLVIAYDQLAGKEMSVGRYYEGNGRYAAAINRFRVVVDKYQKSSLIEEALYRLTASNLALGLVSEAQTAAAVLGHNYPSSPWYHRAFALLQKVGVDPKINPGSTLATAIKPGSAAH